MTMGEKLRQARMEAGLSQRRVCGDRITRNQLSLLEHDRVGPSLETLQYLAGQLGKPVSYFLEETAPNLLALEQARESTNPIQALRALDAYTPDGSVVDDLAALLEAALCLAASDRAASEGRAAYAGSLAQRCRAALERCAFPGQVLAQGALLRQAETAEEQDFLSAAAQWNGTREQLLLARLRLAQNRPDQALALLEDLPDQVLLRGEALYRLGRYAEALELLRRAESQAPPAKAPQLWPLLEACCRECGDYRGAYEYATRQRTGPNPAW